MPLDLSRIGADREEALLRPREIYTALPHRPWPYLRQEQGEVLDKWFEARHQRDIVIKQNTGGGKTVAGLLIAQSTLNEEVGKAVYLAPDKYLAAQVRAEAHRLGLATADDPRDPAFLTQEAILVTNFYKLINGRSVFGVLGDGRDVIDLGVVVVDDAHAALATTEGQFRLTIPNSHSAYETLLTWFTEDLKQQSVKQYRDIRSGDTSAASRIPFWSWSARHGDVMELLHGHRNEDEFMFVWPLISDVLHLCSATVTSRGIEIRPPAPPIRRIPAFANAKRRVYLTATLADDSVLVTNFDAEPRLLSRPVTPNSAADLGDRLILAPLTINRDLDDEAVRKLAADFARGDRDGDGVVDAEPINVVVIVPGDWAADAWRPYGAQVHRAGTLEDVVATLRAGHVGLVVLVNKYDGVDLPGDACRLLVLDGVPRPMDGVERREALALADSPARIARMVQRIEQGMGRGVRDSEDYCAVLLLGAALGVATYDSKHLNLFTPATQAQLELSRTVANQIQGEGLASIREALSVCLSRNENWVKPSRRALAKIKYAATSLIRSEVVACRQAFDHAAAGQYNAAANSIQTAMNAVDDLALRGWLGEQKASYVDLFDRIAAQRALTTAQRDNPFILRPEAGVSPVQVRAAAVQARAAAEYLKNTYADAMELVLGVRMLLDEIQWDEDRTDDAEAAWQKLGLHLGFASSRPEKEYGTGPDNLWALSTTQHAVIELKTGCITTTISKHDLDQLGGSVRWDAQHHPDVAQVPILLHPSRTPHILATPVTGMRIVTKEKMELLKLAVRTFATELANGLGRWGDEQAVAAQLTSCKLTGTQLFLHYTDPPTPPAAN
ncbi:DEAD/DEAH box helicase [Catellatospora vulcania]|uniref:DEAD/DEAH box helicase n=1 Tax=Catellatospora vulcania TaxID=1460450 RepID=UPI001E50C25D|nr:DEAD/DEAH box helicase [Catellatospora vulcania]